MKKKKHKKERSIPSISESDLIVLNEGGKSKKKKKKKNKKKKDHNKIDVRTTSNGISYRLSVIYQKFIEWMRT